MSYECKVCCGEGQLEVTYELQLGAHMEYGPTYEEFTETIMCTDCDGSGRVDESIHAEQNGERIGTVEDWIDSMVSNHIMNGPFGE
jgi:RecJ-like exonuclease